MNKIANIAFTALIATTALVATARGAQAYDGCYPNTAATKINNMVNGGMSPRAAAESQFGETINSEACLYEVKGILRQSYGWN